MQDEIIKHTKNIHGAMSNKNHSFKEKVKEVAVEIFIIVFAVSLSIWLHSWSEERHQQKEVAVFLGNLKNDLKNDISILDEEKKAYEKSNLGYEEILGLTTDQLDSIQKTNTKVNFPVYSHGPKINIGNYEGFKSSGKIGYIEDEKLKQQILMYYQRFVPAINEVDIIYNNYLFKCFDRMIENADKSEKELYSDPKFKKSISFLITIGNNNIRVYEENSKSAAIDLIKAIEEEMNQ